MIFPARRRAWWPFITIPALLFVIVKIQLNNSAAWASDAPTPSLEKHQHTSEAADAFRKSDAVKFLQSQRVQDFWKELHGALTDGDIGVGKLELLDDGPSDEYVDPNSKYQGQRQRENHVDISEEQLGSLQKHYQVFSAKIDPLANRMHYWKNSRGIVMGGGGKYTRIALTSILLLRHVGCKLPIQVFIDTHAEYDAHICEHSFPRLNAECLIMEDVIGDTKIGSYQYKVLSIIFSPFQHVLFLDADAWAIKDPAFLFEVEPYKSKGLITFPDFWVSTASPAFYDITGTPMGSPTERRSSESGILMYNKDMHADSLILTAYFNFYGPGRYYTLLTQGTHGEGDKETYLHAALNLGRPFYDVKEKNGIVGRHINGTFNGAAMVQHDPNDDWKLQEHMRIHGEPKKTKDDKIVQSKPLFVHHNIWKIDLYDLGDGLSPIHKLNEKGKISRVWGDQKDLFGRAGFDIEEMMFRVMIHAKCRVAAPRDECKGLWKYYRTIFKPAAR
ncbi:hypothetical protein jhhlp_007235 [Lomentospora prolificans]|uniref:Alpha-1,2-mannosyltransferase n=1 Tax=Lomentospora prolificans TaxID=41688 RepID=A0A2N3N238_9PEZI|nr:hypothetical protein jhhlp_007235 [Lomentospora prolificans]